MAMGKRKDRQGDLFVATDALQGPGHPFYDAVGRVLDEHGFDAFVEELCAPFYAERRGRPSLPPGIYFRMLFIGYFEGIGSERELAWRCSDSLSLRRFMGLGLSDRVPDHSTLSVIRDRLDPGVYDEVFRFVLRMLDEAGLVKGRKIGVDSSLIEANASMRTIQRKDDGRSYRQYVKDLATDVQGRAASSADAKRVDRRRPKKTSNRDWEAPADPDARITRMKNGSTRLAYKSEHAIDLESGVVLAATLNRADESDHATMPETLDELEFNFERLDREIEGATIVADKGYHSDAALERCELDGLHACIAEPKQSKKRNWSSKKDGDERRRRCYANRRRLGRQKGRDLMRRRQTEVERSFAHIAHRGDWHRTHLRGRENVWKRYLIQVAAHNIGIMLRAIVGAATPKALAAAGRRLFDAMINFMTLIGLITIPKTPRSRSARSIEFHRPHRTPRSSAVRKGSSSTAC